MTTFGGHHDLKDKVIGDIGERRAHPPILRGPAKSS